METNEKMYQLALALAPGVGTKTARLLLSTCGSATQVFKEKSGSLKLIKGLGEKAIHGLQDTEILKHAERECLFMEDRSVKMVFLTDQTYPAKLYHCPDAPVLLFFKGELPHKMRFSLSVIGTREPTRHGRELTITWIRQLAEKYPELYIISGLAYGIDIAAHEAALTSHIKTLGVLGHGFHTLYPKDHLSTARKMLESGGLCSDFFSYNLREPKNFIRRNRIIAGLSEATLIVESQLKGGAMATAEMAQGYDREVLAIPGRPSDPKSIGCNFLIANNQARLVNQSDDIAFALDWDSRLKNRNQAIERLTFSQLSKRQNEILLLLQRDALNINELGMVLKVHPASLSGDLLTLEFGGLIKASPGGRFSYDKG